jgi:hypothetical protein
MDDTNDSVQNHTPLVTIPTEIRAFLESLLADAGMTVLDDTTREEMLKELYLRLDNHLTNTIVEHMPQEHLEEFIMMNQAKKPTQEVQQFLISKMPDAQGVFVKAFDDFRNTYLANVNLGRDKEDMKDEEEEPVQDVN